MNDLLTGDALSVLVVSFGVGIVVGLTGMGGGALMTPALIFLGINPAAAVANDLVAASVNKSVGAAVHWRTGSPNLRLAGLLMIGSVPFAFAGGFIVKAVGDAEARTDFLTNAIGCALLLAAGSYALRMYLQLRLVTGGNVLSVDDPHVHPVKTIIVGAIGGLLVGITSVGSGSLIMVALLLLYPTLSAVRLVGTDLVQAVPLVASAALGHLLFGDFHLDLTTSLLLGCLPGVWLGAHLSAHAPGGLVRRALAFVLLASALKLFNVSNSAAAITLGALLGLGPILWMVVRRQHGFPAIARRVRQN
jgi:uncharacterized protein